MIQGLTKRLASSLLILGLVFLAALWMPSVGIGLILAALSVVLVLEYYHLLDLAGIPCFRFVGAAGGALLIGGTWFLFTFRHGTGVEFWEVFVFFVVTLAVFIRQFPQKDNHQPLATIACTLLGFLYAPFLLNFITKLVFTLDSPDWLHHMDFTRCRLFYYLVIVVKLTDMGAYFIGSRWGKTKLIPRISPGKTQAGFFGGIASGLAGSLLFFVLAQGRFGPMTMTLADALFLGLLLPLIGTAGDLTESLLKRAAGTKDSAHFIPGMGGLLDVFDSLLFTAPVLYLYARLFM